MLPRPHQPHQPHRPQQQSELVLSRRKQINTLMIFNENVSEVEVDSKYRIDFSIRNRPVSLDIYLPGGFPKDRPVIRLQDPLKTFSHPWLDPEGNVVGAPGLLNHSVHSDLGRVAQAIKREFERNAAEVNTNVSPIPWPRRAPNRNVAAISGALDISYTCTTVLVDPA